MNIEDILKNASSLMNNERFNAIVEAKSSGAASTYGVSDIPMDMSEYFPSMGSSAPVSEQPMVMENAPAPAKPANFKPNTKIPAAILESFKEMPPLTGVDPMDKIAESVASSRSVQTPQRSVQQPVSQSIDYSLIKTIVEECVTRNLNSIKQEILSESQNLKGLRIAGGNKIQFVDSKGNLFEGELKLKKKKQ